MMIDALFVTIDDESTQTAYPSNWWLVIIITPCVVVMC